MPRQALKFFCFQTRKGFRTGDWSVFSKKVRGKERYFAIAEKAGNKCVRIITKDMYERHKVS